MSGKTEKLILDELKAQRALIEQLVKAKEAEKWPKTVAEYAAFLGKKVRTVHHWVRTGKLGGKKQDGVITMIGKKHHEAFEADNAEQALTFL